MVIRNTDYYLMGIEKVSESLGEAFSSLLSLAFEPCGSGEISMGFWGIGLKMEARIKDRFRDQGDTLFAAMEIIGSMKARYMTSDILLNSFMRLEEALNDALEKVSNNDLPPILLQKSHALQECERLEAPKPWQSAGKDADRLKKVVESFSILKDLEVREIENFLNIAIGVLEDFAKD